jgi:hypothetical protein
MKGLTRLWNSYKWKILTINMLLPSKLVFPDAQAVLVVQYSYLMGPLIKISLGTLFWVLPLLCLWIFSWKTMRLWNETETN